MGLKLANNATTTLAAAIDEEDTAIPVASGTGGRYPALSEGDWFPLIVVDATGFEIMRATARSGDIITVQRAQEGTSPRSFDPGARVDLRFTAAAMAAIEGEIAAVIAGIETDLKAQLSAPTGTRILFNQTAAPAGWSKEIGTSFNNRALRLVTGEVGSGGNLDFTTVFGRTSTDNHTLTNSQIPSHTHGSGSYSASSHNHTYRRGSTGARHGDPHASVQEANFNGPTNDTGNSGSLNVSGSSGSTGGGNAHSHGIDMRVQYRDVIIAEKAA